MTTIQSIRKTLTDPTPFYAAVGFVDKAVDQVRSVSDDATEKAADLAAELKPELLRDRAQDLPKQVEKQGKAAFAQAEQSYTGLSKRGAGVVAELRKQREAQTQELVNQGKATAASARKVAEDAQAFATKSVLTGRKEAAKQVAAAAGTVENAADKLGDEARTEVRSTASRAGRTAPKQTAAKKTAKKRPARKAPAKSAAKKAPAKSAAKSTTSASTTSAATAAKATATKTPASTATKATDAKA